MDIYNRNFLLQDEFSDCADVCDIKLTDGLMDEVFNIFDDSINRGQLYYNAKYNSICYLINNGECYSFKKKRENLLSYLLFLSCLRTE